MTDSLLFHLSGTRIENALGAVQNGAKIFFYYAGTSNDLPIYLDRGLSTSQANPVETDSAGLVPQIYLGTNPFKYRVETAGGVLLDEKDDLPGALNTAPFATSTFARPETAVSTTATDYQMQASDLGAVLHVNPTSGNVAVTLVSAITAGNGAWATVRHTGTANAVIVSGAGSETIDGVATRRITGQHESVTFVSDGANWHTRGDGNASLSAGTIAPQGYLTLLSSGTDPLNYVPSSDITSAASVYYRPTERGNLLPIYDGTRFRLLAFTDLTLTLVSQHAANTIYDVFAFLDNGSVTIGTGPAWSTSTAGSGARGTGGSTTELVRVLGLPLNANAITCRNGTTTYSVSARRATYLGSILVDGTQGQVSCHVSAGQSRKWGVWNAYNRQPIHLTVVDSTTSWTYAVATFRASNGSANNSCTVFSGLKEELFEIAFDQTMDGGGGTVVYGITGIGWGSTTAASGFSGRFQTRLSATNLSGAARSAYSAPAILGSQTVTALERTSTTNDVTFLGGSDDFQLIAKWRG